MCKDNFIGGEDNSWLIKFEYAWYKKLSIFIKGFHRVLNVLQQNGDFPRRARVCNVPQINLIVGYQQKFMKHDLENAGLTIHC